LFITNFEWRATSNQFWESKIHSSRECKF
jgi:hypothetical protein